MKYEFVADDLLVFGTHKLTRVRALVDFADVKRGDIGGYVEFAHNLSQEGCAWLYDKATAMEDDRVTGDAQVRGESMVYGQALVTDQSRVEGSVWVYGNSLVCEQAHLCDEACISGYAVLVGRARMEKSSRAFGNAVLGGRVVLTENARMFCNARAFGASRIAGNVWVREDVCVYGATSLEGDVKYIGTQRLCRGTALFAASVDETAGEGLTAT